MRKLLPLHEAVTELAWCGSVICMYSPEEGKERELMHEMTLDIVNMLCTSHCSITLRLRDQIIKGNCLLLIHARPLHLFKYNFYFRASRDEKGSLNIRLESSHHLYQLTDEYYRPHQEDPPSIMHQAFSS